MSGFQVAGAGGRLACDFFKLTETEGPGTGESLRQFPIREGDCLLADRGYSTAAGIGYVAAAGGRVTVRVNTGILSFQTPDGQAFDLRDKVSKLESAGAVESWPARVVVPQGVPVTGWVCAIRKTEEAIRIAHEGIRKEAARKGRQVQPKTLEFARYVIVFTTFPTAEFTGSEVLEWYRIRWQVELVFKRFKSLAELEIFRFVEGFYNRKRRHSGLGYLSPVEFEQAWHTQQAAA